MMRATGQQFKPSDMFSNVAQIYSKVRVSYPQELFDFIFSRVKNFEAAWDCATGSGQGLGPLSEKFKLVEASDLSAEQLGFAPKFKNVNYTVATAEEPPYKDNSFDLVTTGTAVHWFDASRFHTEVKRVLKPGGVIAEYWYNIPDLQCKELQDVYNEFHNVRVGPHWDKSRWLLVNDLRDVPFPFKNVEFHTFTLKQQWSFEHFITYFYSWSSVGSLLKEDPNKDPVVEYNDRFAEAWGDTSLPRTIKYDIKVRLGFV